MKHNNLNIRPIKKSDQQEMEILTRNAFWNLYKPGCDEHYLVHILTDHEDYLSQYSAVAEINDKIVGLILYTRSYIRGQDGKTYDVLSFGPLCVDPKLQRGGIGRKLVEYSANLARDNDERAIFIFGNPSNYLPYGFLSSRDFDISIPNGTYPYAMLTLPLNDNSLKGINGELYQSKVFELMNEDDIEEFDKQFPPLKKERLWTQIEFELNVRAIIL